MKHIKDYFSKYYLSKWIVLLFDLSVVFVSWFGAFLLRFNFDLTNIDAYLNPLQALIIIPVSLACFVNFKSYCGILRHSTTKDVLRIISSVVCMGFILTAISLIGQLTNAPGFITMPISVIIISSLLISMIMVLSRLLVKITFQQLVSDNVPKKKVMIFGAGVLGQTTLNAILKDTSGNYKVVGFVDDNPSLQNKYILGLPIYSVNKAFDRIIPHNKVEEIIFAVDNSKITHKRKGEIADKCLNIHLLMKEVPPIKTWIKGELKAKAIRPIRIEDLLGRNSIQLDREKIESGLKQSVVLVSGAAGSIGSEIVRQLISFKVQKVILLDKAESDLYNLEQEIRANNEKTNFEVIVGDVTNETKMRKIFMKYAPTIVFNAAAYKHVPLMEEFPCEAIRVNVGGVKVMADLSIEFGVEKFVLISTDKAVNPTNVMGATKRISEIYVQSLAHSGNFATQFITTRFGNVLGSNGSVVPLFRKQIEKGGPVTITHKEITRYFMTIPEASQLVLEAGFLGKGGEIFVFDMGEPVKIYEMAKRMISLSGFVPEKDIEIKEIGLRPGEKLYEELLSSKETLQAHTNNEKIMIAKDVKYDYKTVTEKISDLLVSLDETSRYQLVKKIMNIVPEFISMNSYYSNGKEDSSLIGQLNTFNRKARDLGFEPKKTSKTFFTKPVKVKE